MPGGVFISYRREDSAGFARLIYDRLKRPIGRQNLFWDIDSIGLGEDFVTVLNKRLSLCDAVVAVIGRTWISCADRQQRRRLDDPADLVRLEIETALKRDIHVIPVFVDGASVPTEEDLPVGLKNLMFRNGIQVSNGSFDADIKRLTRALKRLAEELRQREAAEAEALLLSEEGKREKEATEAERLAREERERQKAAEAERIAREERAREDAAAAARAEEAGQAEAERRAREVAEAERLAREELERQKAAETERSAHGEHEKREAGAIRAEDSQRLIAAEVARPVERNEHVLEAGDSAHARQKDHPPEEATATIAVQGDWLAYERGRVENRERLHGVHEELEREAWAPNGGAQNSGKDNHLEERRAAAKPKDDKRREPRGTTAASAEWRAYEQTRAENQERSERFRKELRERLLQEARNAWRWTILSACQGLNNKNIVIGGRINEALKNNIRKYVRIPISDEVVAVDYGNMDSVFIAICLDGIYWCGVEMGSNCLAWAEIKDAQPTSGFGLSVQLKPGYELTAINIGKYEFVNLINYLKQQISLEIYLSRQQ
jgi:hypothetical protein